MSRHPNPTLSALQARFNVKAFLAARHMREHVQGVMDTTFEWPLNPRTSRAAMNPLAAASALAVVVPIAVGFHSLCVRLTIQWPDAAGRVDLMLGNTKNLTGNEIIIYHATNNGGIPGGEITPVIGGAGIDARGNLIGMKAVYVPEGEQLAMSYTSAAAGDATLTFSVITVPSNQPLSSLFNYS